MSDNWIVENLTNTFNTWNSKLAEIWMLVGQSPEQFKGGTIWNVVEGINGGLKAIGYGLLVLFFAMGVFKSAGSFQELRRPEQGLKFFIRFAAAKCAITYGMDIMLTIFEICGGIVTQIAGRMGGMTASVTIPDEMVTAIEGVDFLASIPLWLVTLLGSLFITALSFVMILTVYSRFFACSCTPLWLPSPWPPLAGRSLPALVRRL